ncbi:MAG: PQQ-binding-like beta-propeller repeat protein [Planctomycetes bacterium]|nr:PQQ-binding-like beta-propeller repeat protein [Planctomycetota bacterium]
MALKGDLASVDLAQVFQMLSLNQKVGILSIDAERVSRALSFDSRGVTIFFDEQAMAERVVQQAFRHAHVDEGALQDCRAHSARTGASVLESLVAGGYVDHDFIAQTTRIELEEDIYDIFFWRRAGFEFHEGAQSLPGRTEVIDERSYFSVDSVIMEAARRIDEWAFIQQRVRSDEDVFRARDVDPSQLRDIEGMIFGYSDGMRNVARIIDMTGMPRFQVFKTLAVLHEGGYIENVPEGELWDYARQCVDLERAADAIDLYELAIRSGVECSAIHAEVAEMYESVEEFARAATHLKIVADSHVEAGEVDLAASHLRHVVEMLPTDLDARDRLVELTVGAGIAERDGFDPVAHGKELVDLYLEIGDIERVRSILEQLLRLNPEDLELKKRLINVHSKAGDTRRVVELYESIAEDLIQHRDPIEAIKYLQKIVMIDRSRRDISERIKRLYEADERRRSRRRSLVMLGALMMLLSVVAGGWYLYEQEARKQMGVVGDTVAQLAGEKRFAEAIAELEAFVAKYPLTMVSREATAERARIESLKGAEEELQRVRERQLELAREEKRKLCLEAWQQYQQFAAAGRLDDALAKVLEVQGIVDELGTPKDIEWARSVNVEKNRFDLERFISDAARLDREAWQHFEAGDWREARKLWLRLVTDFEASKTAQAVRVPVLLSSRPRGATVWFGGKPLTAEGHDGEIVTPAVVMCRPGLTERFELRAAGFASTTLEVDCLANELVEPTLKVVPRTKFEFSSPARSPVAIGRDLIGVGLRNGRFAVAAIDSGEISFDRKLEGLDEVRDEAIFSVDRVFYCTSEGYLVSRRVASGQLLWREKFEIQPAHSPELHSGRLLIADQHGSLHVFDPLTGRNVWSLALGGNPSGAPTVVGGKAYYGLREGRIVVVDLATRQITAKSDDLDEGISTRIHLHESGLLYGTTAGELVCRRTLRGEPTWRRSFGSAIHDRDLIVRGGELVVRSGSRKIEKLRVSDGEVLAELELKSELVYDPVASTSRLYVVRRIELPRRKPYDIVQAFSWSDLELEWEFEDGGRFSAAPTADAHSLFLPDSEGVVLRFR